MTNNSELALDKSEIEDLLQSPHFIKRVRSVRHATQRQHYEAGFAAYRNGHGINLSKAVVANPDSPAFRHNDLMDIADAFQHNPHNVFHVHTLLSPRTQEAINLDVDSADSPIWYEEGYRNDVVFFLHSHPGVHRRTKEDGLRPSVPDIELWEKLDLKSPHVVTAILVAERGLAKMLLWRRSLGREFIQRYQAVDDFRNMIMARKILESCGINTATVAYDAKKDIYDPDPAAIAEELSR